MSINSSIEWTESTWNPMTGCTKVSEGCKNCYAERLAVRLKAMGNSNYTNGFKFTEHRHMLKLPLYWKKPRIVFVNSMSDIFHEDASANFIIQIFNIMNKANQHIFQILTKRTERLIEIEKYVKWTNNIWMGTTVENQDYVCRIDELRKTQAAVKFISFEPLLGPISDVNLSGMDWIIVGGESGKGARPIKSDWVIDIKNKSQNENIPFFFKQWGGVNKKKTGRILEGKIWDEMPVYDKQENLELINS